MTNTTFLEDSLSRDVGDGDGTPNEILVGVTKDRVTIEFKRPLDLLVLSPVDAVSLAQSLLENARRASGAHHEH